MLNGLQTCPDVPGTEKLVITAVDDGWLEAKRLHIATSELAVGSKILPPQQIFCVKGWNRSVCALLVLLAAFEMVPLMEAGWYQTLFEQNVS